MNGIYLFMNGDRGIAVARAVVEAGHKVAQIFVPADREDSAKIIPKCEDLRVPVAQVKNVNSPDFVGTISRSRPRLLIIGGFSTIFRRSLIDTAELGAVNLHAGRLPKYRGGSPLNWQIINGEREAGISVISVDEGIDTGSLVAEARIPITEEDTIATLHDKANALFPRLVLEALDA